MLAAAAPLDHHQRHALNHYVLTGHARHLDGYQGEYDSPSDDTPPHDTDRWRKQTYNQQTLVPPVPGGAIVVTDFPSSIQPRSIPAEPVTPPRGLTRRKSSGQQSPGSASTLPTNSRTEPTVQRDITTWRQSFPLGCPPPEHVPWTGQVSEDDSVIDLAPDPEALSAAATPSSLPPASAPGVEIYQWRYENYVDWWRNRMVAQQSTQGIVSPPPQINEVPSSSSSSSASSRKKSASAISKKMPKRAATAPAAARSVDVKESRMPPTLSIPPPPPPPAAVPEPQVIRVVEIPSAKVPSTKERRPSNDNVKPVYYRLITPRNEPIPVREPSRMVSMSGDKSMGVLLLENPASYRVRDLMAHILSRECSNTTSPPPVSRTSPRLQKKFTEQNGVPPSLRSPTSGGSFAAQQKSQQPPPPQAWRTKIKLYYDTKGGSSSGGSTRGRLSLKRRRLKENDFLPSGAGRDEGSALIVELVREEPNHPPLPTVKGPARPGPMRRGVASMIRGLASGIRSVGDGLAKCADCLSGSAVKSRAGSRKGQ